MLYSTCLFLVVASSLALVLDKRGTGLSKLSQLHQDLLAAKNEIENAVTSPPLDSMQNAVTSPPLDSMLPEEMIPPPWESFKTDKIIRNDPSYFTGRNLRPSDVGLLKYPTPGSKKMPAVVKPIAEAIEHGDIPVNRIWDGLMHWI